MHGNGTAICKHCGKRIKFIYMKSGKKMPVDEAPIYYAENAKGKDRIVTLDGSVVAGFVIGPDDPMIDDPRALIGYISHFATCSGKRK